MFFATIVNGVSMGSHLWPILTFLSSAMGVQGSMAATSATSAAQKPIASFKLGSALLAARRLSLPLSLILLRWIQKSLAQFVGRQGQTTNECHDHIIVLQDGAPNCEPIGQHHCCYYDLDHWTQATVTISWKMPSMLANQFHKDASTKRFKL